MYESSDQRIKKLEEIVEKQGFHIFLLQQITLNPVKYSLYHDIISTNMSEHTFNELRKLTKHFEMQLEQQHYVSMSDFVHQFSKILTQDQPQLAADLASFIPRWLGGVNGSIGFSKELYNHFY